jgi:hypothetical protein
MPRSNLGGTSPPALFAENRGQVDGPARFVSVFGSPVWLTDEGLRLRLQPPAPPSGRGVLASFASAPVVVTGAQVFLTFEGTEPGARLVGIEKSTTLAN